MENLSELKALFYREHVRDRRLTLINYFLILCAIGAFIGFLAFLKVDFVALISDLISSGSDTQAETITEMYGKYMPILVFVAILAYPFYVLWKISKRPKKIEALISRAEKGAKLATVHDHVDYKITIPLFKINFKLCPVTVVQVFFENDTKPYVLPLPNGYIPDMKILLSGVNVEEINKHKADLYGDANAAEEENAAAEEEENAVPTPIKSVDEFRTFLNTELKDDLASLESGRLSFRKAIVIGGIIAVITVIAVIGFVVYNAMNPRDTLSEPANPMKYILPIMGLGVLIPLLTNFFMKKRNVNPEDQANAFGGNAFKEKVISRMVNFINPSVKYIPMAHLSLGDIFESGLFQERNYPLDGSDQISGRHNGVPFISCDLSMQFKRNFSDEKDSPDCAFFGQFFVARFNKSFSTPVYIIPRKNKYSTLSYLESDKGESVKLEDPEFMKLFNVYSKDQVESRYILTPAMMERIKDLAKRTKGEFYIAFYNNKITVANNSGINNFEASVSKSITKNDNQLLVDFYTDMCNQFAIIDELKLNINIWKK